MCSEQEGQGAAKTCTAEICQVCSTSFTWIILLDPLHAWPFGIKTAQWNVFCHGKASEGCENCKSKHWARTEEGEAGGVELIL